MTYNVFGGTLNPAQSNPILVVQDTQYYRAQLTGLTGSSFTYLKYDKISLLE